VCSHIFVFIVSSLSGFDPKTYTVACSEEGVSVDCASFLEETKEKTI
jgi:hypothetical protein